MRKLNHNVKTIIQPSSLWYDINIKELIMYKDLIYFMVLKDIKVLYKQTVLGFSWAIIRPFFSMIIFSIIFGNLAKVPSDGIPYPIFSYSALVPWTYFSTCLTKSTQSLIGSSGVFTKIYFPRLIIPLTPIIAGLVDFFIALSLLFILMFWYDISPNLNIVWIPLLLIIMIITSSGIGIWLSALALQYRDVRYAVEFLSQLLMYAAPVVWPASLLIEKYGSEIGYYYGLYPMAGVIEGFRSALLGSTAMPWDLIYMGFLSSVIIFISGIIYFKNKENIFADVA